jgi:ribosomal protein S18 acetylase RimI-like enzyme
MAPVRFRIATANDARAVAALHADSWRKHYRGAYSDAFLDGDVLDDRNALWARRLSSVDGPTETQVAEDGGKLVGFVHTVLDADPTCGALLDNLHVLSERHRQGIGAALMARSAAFVMAARPGSGLYLWVLEQNVRAQRFYDARGGARTDSKPVPNPGGVPGRLNGTPRCLRYVWPDPKVIAG